MAPGVPSPHTGCVQSQGYNEVVQWDTGTRHHKHLSYYMSDSELDFVSETFHRCQLFNVLTSSYMVTMHGLGNHGPNVRNSKTLKGKNIIFFSGTFTKFSI